MPTVAELGQKIKAKYPGSYDDLADDQLGLKIQAKFPGSYDDFAPAASAKAPIAAGLQQTPAPWGMPSAGPHKTFADTFGHDSTAGKGADFLAGVSDFIPSADSMVAMSTPSSNILPGISGLIRRGLGVGSGVGTEWAVEKGLSGIGVPPTISRAIGSVAGIGVGSRFGGPKNLKEGPVSTTDLGTTSPAAKINSISPIKEGGVANGTNPGGFFSEGGTVLPGTIPPVSSSPPVTPKLIPPVEGPGNIRGIEEAAKQAKAPKDIHSHSVASNAEIKNAKMAARLAKMPTSEIEAMSDADLIGHLKAEGYRPPPKAAGTELSSSRTLPQVRADIIALLKKIRGE